MPNMRYSDMPDDERALEFPTRFPIKAMGKPELNIKKVMLDLLEQCGAMVEPYDISENNSKSGKYVSVTVYIMAQSREQLDNIYEGLADRPEILMTL